MRYLSFLLIVSFILPALSFAQQAEDTKMVYLVARSLPEMNEEQGMQVAHALGKQLNELLRALLRPQSSVSLRHSSGVEVADQIVLAEQIVALASGITKDKMEKAAEDFGIRAGVLTGFIATAAMAALTGFAGGDVDQMTLAVIVLGPLIGGPVGIGGGGVAMWWKERKFRKKFQAAFNSELDAEFRKRLKFKLEVGTEQIYKNLEKLRACTRHLLPAAVSEATSPEPELYKLY